MLEDKAAIAALKQQLGSVAKQREAAQEAAARAQQAVEAVQCAACQEVEEAKAACEERLHEMRTLFNALQVSYEGEIARADAAEAALAKVTKPEAALLVETAHAAEKPAAVTDAPATVQKSRSRARSDCDAGSSSES